jgi:hypothetical protein
MIKLSKVRNSKMRVFIFSFAVSFLWRICIALPVRARWPNDILHMQQIVSQQGPEAALIIENT